MSDRFTDDGGMQRVTNDDLHCRDCVSRLDDTKVYGNTSKCSKFVRKPAAVLSGKRCPQYQQEKRQQ